jgi:predicted RNA binding protein YcfA (HicA-like mRNA interferase family)
VKLPRDLSGREFARLLRRYGYEEIRQSGSHVRLRSTMMGKEHQVTVPAHESLKVGTLSGILTELAAYLEKSKESLAEELFG